MRVELSPRFTEAVDYARRMHDGSVRKGTEIPYLSHPLAVASLVLEAGGDEDQAIAALLHDVAEDCGGEARLVEMTEMFGARVAHIVRGCSDSLTADPNAKEPWQQRKEQHVVHLRDADADVVIVTAADKLHNARSILADVEQHGLGTLSRFNADPAGIAWYYTSMVETLTELKAPEPLLAELTNVVTQLTGRISAGG